MQQPRTLTTARFDEVMASARGNLSSLKEYIQELLVIACYFAFKDGNTTPLNAVLDFATNSKAVSVERITRWVELHAKIAFIKKEVFALNKKHRDEHQVTNPEDFAAICEHLESVKWYDSKPKEVAKSVFDLEGKFEAFIKQVTKHAEDPDAVGTSEQFATALRELKAIKGRLAQMAIVESDTQSDPAPAHAEGDQQ